MMINCPLGCRHYDMGTTHARLKRLLSKAKRRGNVTGFHYESGYIAGLEEAIKLVLKTPVDHSRIIVDDPS